MVWVPAPPVVLVTPQSSQQPPDGGLFSPSTPRAVSPSLGERPNDNERDEGDGEQFTKGGPVGSFLPLLFNSPPPQCVS